MTADLVCKALNMAIRNKRPNHTLIVHSDRGSQYCSEAYRRIIETHGFKGSMSRRGNCYDNAPIESFWGVLKNELVYHYNYETSQQAISDVVKYIELEYNEERLAKHCFAATQDKSCARSRTRIQKGLGMKSPRQVYDEFCRNAA